MRFANSDSRQVTPALVTQTDPQRHPFLAECAFHLAARRSVGGDVDIPAIAQLTSQRSPWFSAERLELTGEESNEVSQLSTRTLDAIRHWAETGAPTEAPVWEPTFPGSGIIDSGIGDFQWGRCLWEFKAHMGGFRALDFRQLATYAALNWAAGRNDIVLFVLFNPRTGRMFDVGTADFARAVSISTPDALWAEVVSFTSASTVSQ